LPFTEFYRRNDENRIGGTTKRKGNLSSPFEKADSQWKYMLPAQQNYKHIEGPPKILQKTGKYIISPMFFTYTGKKMALAIGQQRSILKIQNSPRLFRPWSINIYQKR
jgi:hypothetical protein